MFIHMCASTSFNQMFKLTTLRLEVASKSYQGNTNHTNEEIIFGCIQHFMLSATSCKLNSEVWRFSRWKSIAFFNLLKLGNLCICQDALEATEREGERKGRKRGRNGVGGKRDWARKEAACCHVYILKQRSVILSPGSTKKSVWHHEHPNTVMQLIEKQLEQVNSYTHSSHLLQKRNKQTRIHSLQIKGLHKWGK